MSFAEQGAAALRRATAAHRARDAVPRFTYSQPFKCAIRRHRFSFMNAVFLARQ
jgi:hypothetical protein